MLSPWKKNEAHVSSDHENGSDNASAIKPNSSNPTGFDDNALEDVAAESTYLIAVVDAYTISLVSIAGH